MIEPSFLSILHLEGPIVPAEVVEARARAEHLLERAKHEAEQLRADAQAEVESLRTRERAAVRDAQRGWLERRRQRLARADHLRRVRLCEAALDACLAVVEQVWRVVPEDRGPIIRALSREIVARAPAGRSLELAVHPEDLPLVPEGLPVRGDPGLAPGDLLGHFEGGALDGRRAARAGLALDEVAGALGRLREGS